LIGDTSDNIRGVDGVGPKTASKWLAEFGSLDGVIGNAASLKPERFRAVVSAEAARLRLNRQLTTLNLSLPTVPAERNAANPAELCRLLELYEIEIHSGRGTGALHPARALLSTIV
jgi:DNA polymerase-1